MNLDLFVEIDSQAHFQSGNELLKMLLDPTQVLLVRVELRNDEMLQIVNELLFEESVNNGTLKSGRLHEFLHSDQFNISSD